MFAALHIPRFPLVAAKPEATASPLPTAVLASGQPHAKRRESPLIALNPAAEATGIQTGWPLGRALIRCPNLLLADRLPDAEAHLHRQLTQLASSLTPTFEASSPDTVILDFRGFRKKIEHLLETIDSNEFETWWVRSVNPDLALLAVRMERFRGRLVSATDLDPLPVSSLALLGASEAQLTWLDLLGIRHFGDFRKLPRQAVNERLGADGGRWHDLLNAKSVRNIRLDRPIESFVQGVDLEESATDLAPVLFAIKRLLQTIVGDLRARGLAVGWVGYRLGLEGGGGWERRLRLPEPRLEVAGILRLLEVDLGFRRWQAGVLRVEVEVGASFGVAVQREWFGRELPQPERWVETLARLEALLGPERVGVPSPPESFAPEGFRLLPALAAAKAGVGDYRPESALPLWRYRPPREAVVASEWQDRQPVPLAVLNGPHTGRIVDRRGPFPSSGNWWDPATAWQRLEWDVQLEGSELLRLVFLPPERWQIDGCYG